MTNPTSPLLATTTSLQVKIVVDPPNILAFLAALHRVHKVVSAMPEQLSFTLYHNPKVPGEFKYVEDWNASLEWVMAVSSCFEVKSR
jgi:hypothetical protein